MVKKRLVIGISCIILVGLMFGAFLVFNSHSKPLINQNEGIYNYGDYSLKSLQYEGEPLIDNSIPDSENNKISANRGAMEVSVYPMYAQDIDGKDIVQYVNFSWSGASAQNIGWYFVYGKELEDFKIEYWGDVIYEESVQVLSYENISIGGYNTYYDLGTPDESCEVGSIENTKMFNIEFEINNTLINKTYCFTRAYVSEGILEGNHRVFEMQEKTKKGWKDISNLVSYVGQNLAGNEGYFYKVYNSTFTTDQITQTKWTYTVKDKTKKGKWEILGYDSDIGVIESLDQNRYIYLDPWWNDTWDYKRQITGLNTTYSALYNITYSANMNTDFSDLRFTDSAETKELNFTIVSKTDSTSALIRIDNENASSVYMYYGNSGAASASSGDDTYLQAEAVILMDDGTADDITSNSNDGTIVGADWTASGYIGGAYDFEDSEGNNRISLGTALIPTSSNADWTGCGWIKAESWQSDQAWLLQNAGGGGRLSFGVTNGGNPYIFLGGVKPTATSTLSTGTWGFVCGRRSSGNVSVWLNAVQEASTTKTDGIDNTFTDISGIAGLGFDGLIDEVMIFDYALSDSEIENLYDSYKPSFSVGSEQANNLLAVTSISPANNTNSTSSANSFSCNCSDETGCTSLNLTINGTLYESVTGAGNTNLTLNSVESLTNSYYGWNCTGSDATTTTTSAMRFLNVSFTDQYSVFLTSPANATAFTTNNINFNCGANDTGGVTNLSLVIDGDYLENVTGGGTNLTLSSTEIISDGDHTWYCIANNGTTERMSDENRTFSIDTTPFIEFISPTEVNASLKNQNWILAKVNLTETYFDNLTLKLYNESGLLNSTTFTNSNRQINWTSLGSGTYQYNATVWTNTSKTNSTETRTISLDVGAPVINLISPNQTFESLVSGDSLNLNWTVTDSSLDTCWYRYPKLIVNYSENGLWNDGNFSSYPTGSGTDYYMNYSGTGNFSYTIGASGTNYSWAPLDSCVTSPVQIKVTGSGTSLMSFRCLNTTGDYQPIISYAGGTFYLSELFYKETSRFEYLSCTANHTTFPYRAGKNNLTFYANDTFGNLGSATTYWRTLFAEKERVFNPTAIQTSQETFKISFYQNPSVSASAATLHYNGDDYVTVKTSKSGIVNFTSILDVPADLSGSVGFYWTINYSNATGSYQFNTSNSSQTISNLTFEECFAPTPVGLTLNFTTYDSINLTGINSTFEATFEVYSGTGSTLIEYLFSDLNENKSNYLFCLNSSGENVSLDAFISYDATDYDSREYILDGAVIGNFTQNIPLYLTPTDLTDIVTITVQDQNYDRVAGALVAIQEWNVGTNTYSTIGSLTTSSTGQGIIDLILYTKWYRAVIYVDGDLVEITDVQKLSDTSWVITVQLETDNPYDLFGSIAHGITFDNNTNITSFTWLDTSGYTNRGCLVVYNQTNTGQSLIFSSCVSSVSGTVDYLLVGEGEFTAYGIIYLDGYDTSQIVDELGITLGTPEITLTVSPFGKVISFIAVGTAGLIGVAVGSAIIGGIAIIAVLTFLKYMGFLDITQGFIWGIISIFIIIWAIQRRKR